YKAAAAPSLPPAQKAQLAAAFVQKYPDSDYKIEALGLEMRAQLAQKLPDTIQTAQTLIKTPGADADAMLTADTMIAYLYPTMVQSGDPDMAAKMATLSQAANCGLQLASSAPANQQASFTPVLTNALGFAQLNSKDYDGAIATLTKAGQLNPKDPMPYYWMGIAQVTKPTPDFDKGLFDLAKASVISPNTTSFKSYLTTVYTDYAGTTDGLQDVITAATNNATPPADFKVMSKVDRQNAANIAAYNAEVKEAANRLPPENSFAGIEARLKKPDLAAGEWKKVKGQGFETDGLVTAVTEKTVDIAVGATDPTSATADVRLVLAAPLTKHLKVGQKITFKGVADAFKPNPPDPSAPFLLTLNEGLIDGYSPTGKS
ncbi:MAG: hypothetical protein ACRD1G_06380, partial [Acidimicrobiales bacterium]